MKIIYSFFLVSLINTYSCGQQNKLDTCNTIHLFLEQNYLNKILDLNDTSMNSISIRLIDLTNKFFNCSGGFYQHIPFFIVQSIPLNLNTGRYKDLILCKFEDRKDNLYLEFYCASFKCTGNEKTNYHLEMEYKVHSDGSIKLLKENLGEIDDTPPTIDYEKIKD